MYFRVKRKRTTVFVETLPMDTILQLKGKISHALVGSGEPPRDPREIRLQTASPTKPTSLAAANSSPAANPSTATAAPLTGTAAPQNYSVLEDTATVEQLGLADEQILYMTYWVSGEVASDGKWEPVDVAVPESLDSDALAQEGGEGTREQNSLGKEKGKERA